ncbi:MAG: hypothetical protein WCF19_02025 [Chlamydiales bacterium]
MIYPVNEIKQIEAHTEISFVCHPNCAQYGGPEGDAGYANAVQVERGISLEEAFEIAKNNSEINHFVYVKGDGMTLIGGDPENDPLDLVSFYWGGGYCRMFEHGDVVFFRKDHQCFGAAGYADAYFKQ